MQTFFMQMLLLNKFYDYEKNSISCYHLIFFPKVNGW
ncbi:Uncharacterised protein [Bacteroides fragilis NCTC 9343]|nr:Uncharacterised protein [Bacteroides fragilis NCTC 9343]